MAEREQKTHQMQMRVDPSFLDTLDDWRASQRPVLTRSEAVRILCLQAIALQKKKR